MKVEELKISRSTKSLIHLAIAKINGKQHCTADIRKMGTRKFAAFSNITNCEIDKLAKANYDLVMSNTYLYEVPEDKEIISTQEDYLIWVEFKDK